MTSMTFVYLRVSFVSLLGRGRPCNKAVGFTRVSSVTNWLRLAGTSAFIVAAAAATRGREGVAAIVLLGRNEGKRRYIKGLRFYLTKAGKKAYFCYILPK